MCFPVIIDSPAHRSPQLRRNSEMPTAFVPPVSTRLLPLVAGLWATLPVLALASSGFEPTLGNALNPDRIDTVPARDPDGVDALSHQRSPSGLLYLWPTVPPEFRTSASGWQYTGHLELGAGAVFGDEDSAWWNEYKDLQTGPYLNNFQFQARQPDRALFFEAFGAAPGYRDQFFGIEAGRYNDWKVELFYNEIPHVYTTTYRSLWTNPGSDYLRLGGGLRPGGVTVRPRNNTAAAVNTAVTNATNATQAQLQGVLSALEPTELMVTRSKGGLLVEKLLTNSWRAYGSFQSEHRDGARPFGAVFGGGGGGGNVEIPESIDYTTTDLLGGVRYDDYRNNLVLEVSASMFRNHSDTLTFENPLLIAVNAGVGGPTALSPNKFTTGTFDLYPNNDYYNLRGEYGRWLPSLWNGRFTAVVSLSRYEQNDNLISPTQDSLNGGLINGVPTANAWNTTAALSQQTAEAEIQTALVDLGLTLRPTDKLDLKGQVRWYDTDNKTSYFACNPLTGQLGRLLNDGSGAAIAYPSLVARNNPRGTSVNAYDNADCNLNQILALGLVPAAGNVNIRNVPYAYSRLNLNLSGDYRVTQGQTLTFNVGREQYQREYRERDETWEDSLELGWVNRAFKFGTLRLSGEVARRRGDGYNIHAATEASSAALGPEPVAGDVRTWLHAPTLLRKYDIADRDLLDLNGRLILTLRDDLDLGLSLQYQDTTYPNSEYGRVDHQNLGTANLELNWQPSSRLGLYGWYTYQRGTLEQQGVQPAAVAPGCTIGTRYYFFSNGTVATTARPPAGTQLIGSTMVSAANWASVCGMPAALSPTFPTSLNWDTRSEDTTNVFGAGVFLDLRWARFTLDYSYLNGVTAIDYSANMRALGVVNAAQLGLIGSGMPDLTTTQQILEANLIIPVNKQLALRTLYRYEMGTVDDWHYNGVEANPVPANNAVYLDAGTQDYSTSFVALLLQLSF